MRNLEPDKIIVLDTIIERLNNTSALDDSVILDICSHDHKIAETVCRILEEDGWIIATWVNSPSYPIYVIKSDSFRALLASGNYAKMAKVNMQKNRSISNATNFINARGSDIAIGNNATQTNNKTAKFLEKKSLFWIFLAINGAVAGIYQILSYYKFDFKN